MSIDQDAKKDLSVDVESAETSPREREKELGARSLLSQHGRKRPGVLTEVTAKRAALRVDVMSIRKEPHNLTARGAQGLECLGE